MDGRLAALLDRRAIEDLLIDYCRALDAMDLAALGALFTEDCVVAYGPDPRLEARGRAALVASLGRMWRWRRTAHHLSNARIWIETPDAARAESDVLAWHERPDGSAATLWGRYLDWLVRTPGGWRIAERRMAMLGSDAGFTVPIPSAFRHPPPEGWTPPAGLDR